ncbi:hypothetical protein [Rhodopila sp.]|uniref:hypothetical protein n=1 Tax=Rhodopila sp. TaxID=2480087 RepID=UPI003D0E885D
MTSYFITPAVATVIVLGMATVPTQAQASQAPPAIGPLSQMGNALFLLAIFAGVFAVIVDRVRIFAEDHKGQTVASVLRPIIRAMARVIRITTWTIGSAATAIVLLLIWPPLLIVVLVLWFFWATRHVRIPTEVDARHTALSGSLDLIIGYEIGRNWQ